MESSDDTGGAGLESSDQAICTISSTTDDQQQQQRGGGQSQSAVVVRWYECNFCKRGFSNAQALGGHMNIHRKHKKKAINKLNQAATSSSNATPPISPIPINTSNVPQYPLDQNYCLTTTKWPWIFSPEGDAYDQWLGPADHHQLDLELRLGHAHAVPDLPQINAWPPTGMKKFL